MLKALALTAHNWSWDYWHGVETRRPSGQHTATSSPYEAVNPWRLRWLLRRIPQPLDSATFIDIGSGKGRALVIAQRYPFDRIIGVELSAELHAAAVRNVSGSRVELICGDACTFDWPRTPLVVHLFNPFPEPVMAQFVDHLRQSWMEHPRPIAILCAGRFTAQAPIAAWLPCLDQRDGLAIYHQG